MADPLAEEQSASRWWRTADGCRPQRNTPVLCAWKSGAGWTFDVAKWTGKRWLEVVPETANEEFLAPDYYQDIEAPT